MTFTTNFLFFFIALCYAAADKYAYVSSVPCGFIHNLDHLDGTYFTVFCKNIETSVFILILSPVLV